MSRYTAGETDAPSRRPNRSSLSAGFPTSSESNSGVDQLRRNLHGIRLRDSMHRPYHPSPLSQSPLQASISSASQTAASVASSSRNSVSTSTTPLSTSSRFSINQAFKSLTDDDIEFFDRLVTQLPPHAGGFSQLKSAYTAHLPEELDQRYGRAGSSRDAGQVDWDAHLWSILLNLVKVRGSTWRERWDSVRLAFGLDPNSGDETDLGSVTQSSDPNDSGSTTRHRLTSPSEQDSDESQHHYTRETGAPAGPASDLTPRQSRAPHSVSSSRYQFGLPRSSSPPPRRKPTQALVYKSPLSPQESPQEVETWLRPSNLDDPISAIQARLSCLLDTEEEPDERSETDLEATSFPASTSLERDEVRLSPAARLPADARRRFDELVRSSQLQRSRLRQSHMQLREREERAKWGDYLEMADLWRAQRLLRMCLAWWIALTRQQLVKAQNAADASARVTIDKAWERWRALARRELDGRCVGAKTDRVRCTLTAFRRWKRLARSVVERREELKKEEMRSAYYTTASAVKIRILRQTFRIWRERYMTQIANKVRHRHLQAGALALWQMRSSHTRQLQTREKIMTAQRNTSTLTQAWERWMDRFDATKALNQFQRHHNRLLASETIHTWRKKAVLSKLSQVYSERRLKLAALDGWKDAIEKRQFCRKQEALAARWRVRRLKQSTLITWRRLSQKILTMERQATSMQNRSDRDRLFSVFRRWQLESHATVLERALTAKLVQRVFYQWKHRYTALTTSLENRESGIIHRRKQATSSACFQRWRQLTRQIRDQHVQVEARRNAALCNGVFIAWRNKQLEHRLLQQKSAAVSHFFMLRSTLRQWRTRLQEHRADVKEAKHNRRLAQQVFEIWKARSAKQQRLATLLQHSVAKSYEALARSCLNQWVARIIEVRSRELEVKEQRERRLVKAAFYAWIEACLRHDDLLALMNSYIDVKEEDRKRRIFLHWLNTAREHKERRENAEKMVATAQKKLLVRAIACWQDKFKERALATQEYDMLMRRQQLLMRWALDAWKSYTLFLPAIRLRNTSLKRTGFRQWRQILPYAQMFNQATRIISTRRLHTSWQTWMNSMKFKRQLRAAARFSAGSISVQRLRTLSAAAAANRSTGSSSPSAANSSSPFRAVGSSTQLSTPMHRPKTSPALLAPELADNLSPDSNLHGQASRPEEEMGFAGENHRRPSSFRRSSSVPRHLEASLKGGSFPSRGTRDTARFAESISPSREAASRRGRRAMATTPTSNRDSERSRFSRALQSSSSSVSAGHESAVGDDMTQKNGRKTTNATGPTLSSVARPDPTYGQAQSDIESYPIARTRRSAKYEQTSLATRRVTRSPTVGLHQLVSNDGFDSGNSVQSAPAQPRHSGRSRAALSLGVAEDLIVLLRTRAKSRQHEQS